MIPKLRYGQSRVGSATDPIVGLFISIGLGHLGEKVAVGPIHLDGVCSILIVALVIGQLGAETNADLENVAFAIFIYALVVRLALTAPRVVIIPTDLTENRSNPSAFYSA
ncbi:membrane hypothetical protein [Agrobacterium fabacearum S56]|nr:hypothetical protein At1D1108_47370 [Agrobacterium tumefaciens]CUX05638.1 membrane hypothetical protein [Agrobacterium fabacearum S56]